MPDKYRVCEDQTTKIFMSEEANYFFNKKTGYMSTWGKTPDEDAVKFPAPTLLDMEVTTICKGVDGKPCPFCFPEGTMIDMYDGTRKPIEEIKAGDEVRTYNTESVFHFGWKGIVKETSVREYEGDLISITLENDKVIRCTPNHRFLTKRGWIEAQNLLETDVLTGGVDRLFHKTGKDHFKGKVYNFACDPFQNYLVEDCVVHNCYKSNSPNGKYMSFETFRDIFDKMPKSITQIAFGADAQATSNPDLFRMMSYARSNGVIPNITVAQITDETAEKLVKVCGAVAVSYYPKANPDACLDSVYKLTSRGMKQVNIHMMISEDTLEDTFSLLDKCGTDKRLEGLNAVVFLSLKKKGRGTDYTVLSQDHFDEVVQYAMSKNIRIGFDSCSSYKSLKFFSKDEDALGRVKSSVISCESTLESCYIAVDGKFFPCSFMEGEGDWKEGLDVLTCKDFVTDVWNNPKTEEFRKSLLSNITYIEGTPCRMCPFFEV